MAILPLGGEREVAPGRNVKFTFVVENRRGRPQHLDLTASGVPAGWALHLALDRVDFDVRRGEILVFKYPEEPERDFIKRVIGLPGETIELRNKKVYVDGKPLDEPYVHFLFPVDGRGSGDADFTDFDVRRNYGPVTVPSGHYFMMGDNRDNSSDSRYWGFVPREFIVGKALIIYWSYETDSDEYRRTDVVDRLQQITDLVSNFFTKTRWSRTFKIIR